MGSVRSEVHGMTITTGALLWDGGAGKEQNTWERVSLLFSDKCFNTVLDIPHKIRFSIRTSIFEELLPDV